METETAIEVCGVSDIEPGGMLPFDVNGRRLVLYRVGDEFFISDNICPHGFALLSDGWFEEFEVECPLHGALFDVRNGKVTRGPAECGVMTYSLTIKDGRVLLTDGV